MKRVMIVVIMALSAACGGGSGGSGTPTTPTPAPQANRNPTITSMTVSPTFGIAGMTQFNYSSSATDPDGDTLTYAWEFGDGQTRTGAAVAYNYPNVFGTGTARLTVTDGRGGSVTDTRPVTVGNMSGEWSGTVATYAFRMSLTQSSNGTVTGTWSFPGTTIVGQLDPAGANKIDSNAHVVLRCKATGGVGPFGVSDFTLDGQMQTTGTAVNGGTQGSGFTGQPFALNRQ
jgi:hypothetical protein